MTVAVVTVATDDGLSLHDARNAIRILTYELRSKAIQNVLAIARNKCGGRKDRVAVYLVPIVVALHRYVMWLFGVSGDLDAWFACLKAHEGDVEFDALEHKFNTLLHRASLLRV